jgi:CheY-like chemotaxis protein
MKRKVLIVEDNNDFREILSLLITRIGYHAITAQNSKEAIACAEAEQPALIFMDMGLPDCDGINTSAILKQSRKTSHIPIVALTAWMSELWREKASKVGIETYLLNKTGFTSDVKTDDRGIHCESLTRGNAIILSIFHYHGPVAVQPNDVSLGFKTANACNTNRATGNF